MKKTYLISSILIFTFLLSGVASAKVYSTSTNEIGAIKQKIAEVKQTTSEEKARVEAEMASSTSNIKNLRQDLKNEVEIKIGKKLDAQKIKIANVFEKSITNLKDLIARIESRISKIEISGLNASSSKALLEIAKTKTADADTELTNLENLLATDIPAISTSTTKNNERKAILKNINLQSEKTKSAIKVAHKSIIEVIASLKKGQLKDKNSTSTHQDISTSTNN